jgi:hypothetical protein
MMDAGIIRCSLPLDGFDLDFVVKVDESIEWTKAFGPDDREYAFARGEIWVRTAEEAILLIDEEPEPGDNLLILLGSIGRTSQRSGLMPDLEEKIPLGGWCHWMRGYWDRLVSDKGAQDDGATYALLAPALLVDGKSGWIAAYRYGNVQVLEVGTRSASFSAWSEVNPDVLCASIDAASSRLSDAIRMGR